MSEQPWTTDLYAILPHPTEPRLLLLPAGKRWQLPHQQLAQHIWTSEVGQVTDSFKAAPGLPGEAFRCVYHQTDDDAHAITALFAYENDDGSWAPPPGWRWVDVEALAGVPLVEESQRPYIDSFLAELGGAPPPPHRAPWALPGWLAEARAWTAEALTTAGQPLTGPLQLIRSWSITSMLRGPTAAGDIYFKATRDLPLFVDEGRLQAGLAAWFPGEVPLPLAVHPEHNWMITADFGQTVSWHSPRDVAADIYRRYCHLQQATAVDIDRLLDLGCLDRRPAVLAGQLETALAIGFPLSRLTEAEKSELRARVPWLQAACAALASFDVPSTLVHGDLHFANVAEKDGQYRFYDWSDACVAHPFFDTIKIAFQSDEKDGQWLQERYLDLWTEYETPARLAELWTLAQPLSALHQAISYVHIVANVEPSTRHELQWGITQWFRRVLAKAQEAVVRV